VNATVQINVSATHLRHHQIKNLKKESRGTEIINRHKRPALTVGGDDTAQALPLPPRDAVALSHLMA
jgi:hypothetical protein